MTAPPSPRPPHTIDVEYGTTEDAVSGDVGEVNGLASARPTPTQLADAVTSQVVIEQAKGMLMFVYGVDSVDAFEILRWHSQEHDIELRLIAQQILADLTELSMSKGPARHVRFDGLMFTAHQRVSTAATRYRRNQPTTTLT
jgi:hypothetical protein